MSQKQLKVALIIDPSRVASTRANDQCKCWVRFECNTHEYMILPDELKRLGMGETIIVNKQTFAVNSVMIR